MPAPNEARYLASSIESILTQTLGDFEFVILDDASTDGTWRVLEDWARRDRRIRLLQYRRRGGFIDELRRRRGLPPITREGGRP